MTGPVPYHVGRFPPTDLQWQRIIPLVGPANAALARYDGLLSAVPNASVLLSPLTTQEAVLSSRIEGTQATMGEVLQYEASGTHADIDSEKALDIDEILNYRRAMHQAVELLDGLPLCQRLIRSLHETLLAGVRGDDRGRGRYRTIQNFIGTLGRPIEEARFVPVATELLPQGMDRWEKYLHAEEPDSLVQLAIAHAEFESLHPFLDGNGRLGRMLVPVFLFARKLLHTPTFYLSEYLEAHREEYYHRLLAISRDDDWTGWCEFFLRAIMEQAGNNERKARSLLGLYEEKKGWMTEATHSMYGGATLDFLFSQPIFSSTHFVESANIPPQTARRILKVISEKGLLRILRPARGRTPGVYAFAELLNVAEGRTVF